MKKFIKIIFTVFVFLVATNFAEAASVNVSVTGKRVFTDEITLTVRVSNIVDFKGSCNGLCSFSGTFEYSESRLELVSVNPLNGFLNNQNGDQVSFTRSTGVLSTTNVFTFTLKGKNLRQAAGNKVYLRNIVVGNGTDQISVDDVQINIVHQLPGFKEISEDEVDAIVNGTSGINRPSSGSSSGSGSGSSSGTTTTKSSNSKLQSIELSSGHIEVVANNVDYEVNVDNSVSSITIAGATEDENATVTGFGVNSLNVGENIFPIVVTAENGNQTTYTIKINRLEEGQVVPSTPSEDTDDSEDENPESPTIENDNSTENNSSRTTIIIISLVVIVALVATVIVIVIKKNKK